MEPRTQATTTGPTIELTTLAGQASKIHTETTKIIPSDEMTIPEITPQHMATISMTRIAAIIMHLITRVPQITTTMLHPDKTIPTTGASLLSLTLEQLGTR